MFVFIIHASVFLFPEFSHGLVSNPAFSEYDSRRRFVTKVDKGCLLGFKSHRYAFPVRKYYGLYSYTPVFNLGLVFFRDQANWSAAATVTSIWFSENTLVLQCSRAQCDAIVGQGVYMKGWPELWRRIVAVIYLSFRPLSWVVTQSFDIFGQLNHSDFWGLFDGQPRTTIALYCFRPRAEFGPGKCAQVLSRRGIGLKVVQKPV